MDYETAYEKLQSGTIFQEDSLNIEATESPPQTRKDQETSSIYFHRIFPDINQQSERWKRAVIEEMKEKARALQKQQLMEQLEWNQDAQLPSYLLEELQQIKEEEQSYERKIEQKKNLVGQSLLSIIKMQNQRKLIGKTNKFVQEPGEYLPTVDEEVTGWQFESTLQEDFQKPVKQVKKLNFRIWANKRHYREKWIKGIRRQIITQITTKQKEASILLMKEKIKKLKVQISKQTNNPIKQQGYQELQIQVQQIENLLRIYCQKEKDLFDYEAYDSDFENVEEEQQKLQRVPLLEKIQELAEESIQAEQERSLFSIKPNKKHVTSDQLNKISDKIDKKQLNQKNEIISKENKQKKEQLQIIREDSKENKETHEEKSLNQEYNEQFKEFQLSQLLNIQKSVVQNPENEQDIQESFKKNQRNISEKKDKTKDVRIQKFIPQQEQDLSYTTILLKEEELQESLIQSQEAQYQSQTKESDFSYTKILLGEEELQESQDEGQKVQNQSWMKEQDLSYTKILLKEEELQESSIQSQKAYHQSQTKEQDLSYTRILLGEEELQESQDEGQKVQYQSQTKEQDFSYTKILLKEEELQESSIQSQKAQYQSQTKEQDVSYTRILLGEEELQESQVEGQKVQNQSWMKKDSGDSQMLEIRKKQKEIQDLFFQQTSNVSLIQEKAESPTEIQKDPSFSLEKQTQELSQILKIESKHDISKEDKKELKVPANFEDSLSNFDLDQSQRQNITYGVNISGIQNEDKTLHEEEQEDIIIQFLLEQESKQQQMQTQEEAQKTGNLQKMQEKNVYKEDQKTSRSQIQIEQKSTSILQPQQNLEERQGKKEQQSQSQDQIHFSEQNQQKNDKQQKEAAQQEGAQYQQNQQIQQKEDQTEEKSDKQIQGKIDQQPEALEQIQEEQQESQEKQDQELIKQLEEQLQNIQEDINLYQQQKQFELESSQLFEASEEQKIDLTFEKWKEGNKLIDKQKVLSLLEKVESIQQHFIAQTQGKSSETQIEQKTQTQKLKGIKGIQKDTQTQKSNVLQRVIGLQNMLQSIEQKEQESREKKGQKKEGQKKESQ